MVKVKDAVPVLPSERDTSSIDIFDKAGGAELPFLLQLLKIVRMMKRIPDNIVFIFSRFNSPYISCRRIPRKDGSQHFVFEFYIKLLGGTRIIQHDHSFFPVRSQKSYGVQISII